MTNLKTLSDTELEAYISDPDALYHDAAKQERERRQTVRYQYGMTPADAKPADEAQATREKIQRLLKTEQKQAADPDLPFDPRTDVSADAKLIAAGADRIVNHMWIIAVLLPIALGVLFGILRAISRS